MPVRYAHPVDVLRKFDPQLSESDLSDGDFISPNADDLVIARLEAVTDDFDDLGRRPMREARVGSPGHPATYEYKSADVYRYQRGVKVWLDNDYVHPIDTAEGDKIEIRSGKDAWKDITAQEGERWEMHYPEGWLRVFSRLVRTMWRRPLDDRFVRITYRHGALGGDRNRGGQTTISGSHTDQTTSISVADAARLPSYGLVLVDNGEYMRVESVDYSTDTLTVTRAERLTGAASYSGGETVHYCPANVREGVAAQTARELVVYDDYADEMMEGTAAIDPRDKLEEWKNEWESALARHSGVRSA